MQWVDNFLDQISMYRLALLGLGSIAGISIIAAFLQLMPYSALDMTLSLVLLLAAGRISNSACALLTKAAPTPESAYITGLILFFILQPLQSAHEAVLLIVFACIAMLSKYILAINTKHVFNPAALSAFAASILSSGLVVWWVATPILFPFVLVLGLLIVRKLRRFDLVLVFGAVALGMSVVSSVVKHVPVATSILQLLLFGPLVFVGTIMLTEPQTTPPLRNNRFIYGGIVGFLFPLTFHFGLVTASPELALLVGNIYSYVVSFRRRIMLTFRENVSLTRDTYEFVFEPHSEFAFIPGQYAEWTLPHRKTDKRSNRRYFTFASAPEDPHIRVGLRIPVESSSFKKQLQSLSKGSKLSITGVSGEFTLPRDPNQKVAAIGVGMGITPFVSMFRHLQERGEHRDITLIYGATSPLDFAYKEELEQMASKIGLRIIYLPTDFPELSGWTGRSGFVTEVLVKEEINDFAKRQWYLAGPPATVSSYKSLLHKLGIPAKRIKTDYFPGL